VRRLAADLQEATRALADLALAPADGKVMPSAASGPWR